MPKPPATKANAPTVKKTKLSLQLREVLGRAYGFVNGERFTEQVAAVTLEALMQEQINQIEGTDGKTDIRLNKRDELDKLITEVSAAVEEVKKLPPEAFKIDTDERSNSNQANTELEVPS